MPLEAILRDIIASKKIALYGIPVQCHACIIIILSQFCHLQMITKTLILLVKNLTLYLRFNYCMSKDPVSYMTSTRISLGFCNVIVAKYVINTHKVRIIMFDVSTCNFAYIVFLQRLEQVEKRKDVHERNLLIRHFCAIHHVIHRTENVVFLIV